MTLSSALEGADLTVYVDDSCIPAKVGRHDARWSHLFADTQEELHEFAASIGLRRSWFQPGRPQPDGTPSHLWHYDVTGRKRHQAIEAGAVPVTWRQAAEMMTARRQKP